MLSGLKRCTAKAGTIWRALLQFSQLQHVKLAYRYNICIKAADLNCFVRETAIDLIDFRVKMQLTQAFTLFDS